MVRAHTLLGVGDLGPTGSRSQRSCPHQGGSAHRAGRECNSIAGTCAYGALSGATPLFYTFILQHHYFILLAERFNDSPKTMLLNPHCPHHHHLRLHSHWPALATLCCRAASRFLLPGSLRWRLSLYRWANVTAQVRCNLRDHPLTPSVKNLGQRLTGAGNPMRQGRRGLPLKPESSKFKTSKGKFCFAQRGYWLKILVATRSI